MVGWGQLFASRLGIVAAGAQHAAAAERSSNDGEHPAGEVISLEECRRLLQETARELQASGGSAATLRRTSTRRRVVNLDFEPFDEPYIFRLLTQTLRRWWETHPEVLGQMAVALVGPNEFLTHCDSLDPANARRLLCSVDWLAAELAADQGSSTVGERALLALKTPVHTRDRGTRLVTWSCTVVHSAGGLPESIVATGIDHGPYDATGEVHPAEYRVVGSVAPALYAAHSLTPGVAAPGIPVVERRQRQRLPYPYLQRVAPLIGAQLPRLETFREVRCRDISQGGVSFFSPAPPQSPALVFELGTCAPHNYVRARVAHQRKLELDGPATYVVGCQFTGRADY